MLGFSFLIAVVALVLAVVFWFQGQSAASVVKALRDEADAARKEAETARGELRKATEELKARSAQLTETRDKLTESVRLHMRSDVPVGVLLSGGLDSSSVASVMCGLGGAEIPSYSVGFDEDASEDSADLRQVIKQTVGAIVQVASAGTPAQQARAVQILADTRRKLYGLLAEGPDAAEEE